MTVTQTDPHLFAFFLTNAAKILRQTFQTKGKGGLTSSSSSNRREINGCHERFNSFGSLRAERPLHVVLCCHLVVIFSVDVELDERDRELQALTRFQLVALTMIVTSKHTGSWAEKVNLFTGRFRNYLLSWLQRKKSSFAKRKLLLVKRLRCCNLTKDNHLC